MSHYKCSETSRRALSSIFTLGFILLVIPSAFGQPRTAIPPEFREAIERIEEMTALELAKENLGSVTVGIVSGADLVWTRSFGFADMEEKVLATENSIYRIGSITKQFTGLMLLQLAERGRVRLSDPVEEYFPEVNEVEGRIPGTPPITLVQLATMTSGLAREPEDLPTFLKGPVSEWEKVLISALPRLKYQFEPDTQYLYSNIGYAILGAALSRAAGQPFTDYVRKNFFDPLGMEHSFFEPNPGIQDSIAKGYAIQDDGKLDWETPAREHQGRGYKVPNGAMYTTVGDLAKFIAFELGEGPDEVIKKETIEDNFSRVNSATGDLTSGYGIGFRVRREGDVIIYGHGGSVAGYRAGAYFDRASKTGVIVLRNVGGRFPVSDVAYRALRELASAK
jgi:CubicO group peptidase (beta-lactamase class C family)